MATVRKRPVLGRHPSSTALRAVLPERRLSHLNSLKKDGWTSGGKPEEFIYYSDSDDESTRGGASSSELSKRLQTTSNSFVDYHADRQSGLERFYRMKLDKDHATKHLLSYSMMRERTVDVSGYNKVFCSCWLSDNQLVFGTKCNKILVYNVRTRKIDDIPMLLSAAPTSVGTSLSAPSTSPSVGVGGVYSLSVNPSRTLLATSAANCVDLAVYKLPTLDPVSLGQNGHRDWVHGSVWLDDERVVTGGRDSCVALWRVPDTHVSDADMQSAPSYATHQPIMAKRCKTADKVRAVVYNDRDGCVATLSLNAYVHLFDSAGGFRQRMSRRLPHAIDNVCLTLGHSCQVYAVGSKSHTTLLEPKSLRVLKKIPAKYHGCGIRSLSFNGDILTIGTGNSVVMFYDLRAQKYLDSAVNAGKAVVFKAASGWTSSRYQMNDPAAMAGGVNGGVQVDHTPAIYTHCYDQSGSRLFTAGGPLSIDVNGCYAGIWM